MDKLDRSGLTFGFTLILIWLTLLTGYLIYDKMDIGSRVIAPAIILPPLPEGMEVYDYE